MDTALTISMFAVNLVVSIVMAIGLMWVRHRTSKIDGLEAEVKQFTANLIDTKFEAIEGSIKAIEKRLEAGDHAFRQNLSRDHELELKTLQAVTEIQRDMATREDLQVLGDKVNELNSRVTVLEQRGGAA
ncbi:hypothetical protein [Algisphaera agarilytica]|uniref:Putative RecB family endonuclease n=1 Tax=Algisphaera agarilytica TaxID=1385975 RepID=A0A7X0LJW8_9BACT|nr:hypothetical protein [Algisphaera agarilytica]MBB6429209.1 putative RecB family endonuclease [Algisphaera agarilytica]